MPSKMVFLQKIGAQPLNCVARFTLAGAASGVLVGLFEAGLLFLIPQLAVLRQPDVRYFIWFISPFAGLLLFGVLGLTVGVIAATRKKPSWWRDACLAATGLGALLAYATACVTLLHFAPSYVLAQNLFTFQHVNKPSAAFLATFVAALVCFAYWPRRLMNFFDVQKTYPITSGARIVLATLGVILCGLGSYAGVRPILGKASALSLGAKASQSAEQALAISTASNIVLISLDTVRADHLSAYGYAKPITPNLDGLAMEGVLFEQAIAPSSWTLPAHASILTGLLAHQHGAGWNRPMPQDQRTLPGILRSRGYETAGFNANLYYGQRGWGLGQGFEYYRDDSSSLRHNLAATLAGRGLIQEAYQTFSVWDFFDRRNAREVNLDMRRWLERRSGRPFFLFVNYFDAHDPYLSPFSPEEVSRGIPNKRWRDLLTTAGSPDHAPLSQKERTRLIHSYDASLEFLDQQVGDLLHLIRQASGARKTVFIVTADHGEGFGEHATYSHGWNLYREVLHVPLIIAGPGIPRGMRVKDLVGTQNLFDTILDLAIGQAAERILHGGTDTLSRYWNSFVPRPALADQFVISELVPIHGDQDSTAQISLTNADWQYIRTSDGKAELYHWTADPGEKFNLVHSPTSRSIAEWLALLLYRQTLASSQPWRGGLYLSALDSSGLFFRNAASAGRSGPTRSPREPAPGDKDLIESIPYH